MDDEFLVDYKYGRFWRGSETSIYAEIRCFSSYSPANGLNLRLHSHEFKFLFEVSESQTAFHEFKFLFPANGLNLRLHSMSSYSQPMYSISDCIP